MRLKKLYRVACTQTIHLLFVCVRVRVRVPVLVVVVEACHFGDSLNVRIMLFGVPFSGSFFALLDCTSFWLFLLNFCCVFFSSSLFLFAFSHSKWACFYLFVVILSIRNVFGCFQWLFCSSLLYAIIFPAYFVNSLFLFASVFFSLFHSLKCIIQFYCIIPSVVFVSFFLFWNYYSVSFIRFWILLVFYYLFHLHITSEFSAEWLFLIVLIACFTLFSSDVLLLLYYFLFLFWFYFLVSALFCSFFYEWWRFLLFWFSRWLLFWLFSSFPFQLHAQSFILFRLSTCNIQHTKCKIRNTKYKASDPILEIFQFSFCIS